MPRGVPKPKNAKPNDIVIGNQIVDQGQNLDPVVTQEKDFDAIIGEEAFMNQILTVEIPSTGDDSAPPDGILSVNGISQGWLRDTPIKMRRMFVEVLARCKETKFTPQTPNMENPESTNIPKGRTAFALPFSVLEDPHPKGRAWLAAIKAEPA
ncbi:MAG: hypothetical protein JO269_09665 [Burkholderiaceae bacterium]|nr:hypothetical protein [Burkholderiaceae bacterium]